MRIQFFVNGRPAPGGSKSVFPNKKTGKIIVAPASKYTKLWMERVKRAAKMHYKSKPLESAVSLKFTFTLSRPKSHYTSKGNFSAYGRSCLTPIFKPDLTKLIRSTEDALTGILWKDDSQVVVQNTAKWYCDTDQKEGVHIEVETLYEEE